LTNGKCNIKIILNEFKKYARNVGRIAKEVILEMTVCSILFETNDLDASNNRF